VTPAEPYLTVTEIEGELALRRIDCPIAVRPGTYRVLIDGAWVELYAVEPRITTGAGPIRAVVLHGSGAVVASLVRLEAALRSGAGPVHMETQERRAFSVVFEKFDATLSLYGRFHRDRRDPEIDYRITLPDRTITGFAIDRERERRRLLALTELSVDDEQALVRAFTSHQVIEVEQIT
jgi:hypothetical protein